MGKFEPRCIFCSESIPTFEASMSHVCHTSVPPSAVPVLPSPWGQKRIRNPQDGVFFPPLVLGGSDSDEQNKKPEVTPAGPAGNSDNDLDNFIWNPNSQSYDKDEPAYKIYRTKCECGLEAIGYKVGHSDWCPRKAIDG